MQMGPAAAGRTRVAQTVDELDLGALGRSLWRRKRLILGLTLAAAAIAFVAVNLVTPRYKSEARVLIETRDNIFLRPEAERANERTATVDQEAMTSQVQLVLSRDLALDVIRRLKLGEKPEFDPVLRGTSAIRSVLGVLGLAKDPMNQTPEERVLRSYQERLVSFQVEKSRVIAIEFESQDPALAAQAPNTVAERFLIASQAAKQQQSREAGEFLAGEIEKLRKSLAEAETKLENYRSTTNLMIGTNNTTLSSQQLGDINARLATARAERADAESKARSIRDALRRGAAAESSDIMNSETLRRMSEQRTALRAQLAEQSSTLLPRHPRIKELNAQIADLERQMRAEAERLARAFENDAKLAASRMEELMASLSQLKKQAASSSVQDAQLRALEREAKSQRDLLESYLLKYRETTARDNIGAASPDARIISHAIVSTTPSWPKKLPTVLVAAFVTFALAAGFVLSAELMSGAAGVAPAAAAHGPLMRHVPAAAPVISYTITPPPTSPPPAAAPPLASAAPPVGPAATVAAPPVAAPPTSSIRDTIHKLRALARSAMPSRKAEATSLPPAEPLHTPAASAAPVSHATPASASAHTGAASSRISEAPAPATAAGRVGVPLEAVEGLALALGTTGDSGRRIAMVGARRNMGTTMAAISLARALGKQGRTILVDLALKAPNLAAIASEASAPGVSDLVEGNASFGDIITRDRYSRVHLITAGKFAADHHAILSSQRLSITLEALARSYDYVVLDAGALPDIAPDKFAALAPRAVLVADDIDGPVTESARDRLLAAGFPNVSVLASSPQGPESDANGARAAA